MCFIDKVVHKSDERNILLAFLLGRHVHRLKRKRWKLIALSSLVTTFLRLNSKFGKKKKCHFSLTSFWFFIGLAPDFIRPEPPIFILYASWMIDFAIEKTIIMLLTDIIKSRVLKGNYPFNFFKCAEKNI